MQARKGFFDIDHVAAYLTKADSALELLCRKCLLLTVSGSSPDPSTTILNGRYRPGSGRVSGASVGGCFRP
jgi:hypothetical protein